MQQVEFAISYAGEDSKIAEQIDIRLREMGFEVFFAKRNFATLVGARMDTFFEEFFNRAIQVIVLISENYRRKDWTQYEWDVIRKRDLANRFIPVRLDNTSMLGLPSTYMYLEYDGNVDIIVDVAVRKLLEYEQSAGIKRPSDYERILYAIKNESKGAVAQAYQLIKDKRKRDPLGNVDVPICADPIYRVVEEEWFNFSVVKRLSIKVILPKGLSHDLVILNLKHCAANFFNANKPDAMAVYGYFGGDDIESYFTAGKVVFAPFGKWDKAQDGVAYNIPVTEFEYSVEIEPDPLVKLISLFAKE